MIELKSFGALARAFERNIEILVAQYATAMEITAIAVLGEARSEIGHYQREDTEPAEAWPELLDATKKARLRGGFSENDPLLRSGDLWASIKHESTAQSFVVGSDSKIAEYMVMGTPTVPPRDFLSPALHRNIPFILSEIGKAVEATLSGK